MHPKMIRREFETHVVVSDYHLPHHDKRTTGIIHGFVGDFKPDFTHVLGDLVDFYEVSKYDKDPLEPSDINKERRAAADVLEDLKKKSGAVEMYEGNHEDRMYRYICKNAPVFKKVGTDACREIIDILSTEHLLYCDKLDIPVHPYMQKRKIGNLSLWHGDVALTHSGWTAKKNFLKFGKSLLTGHSHRLGAYYTKNGNGVHGAWENGCACDLNPHYMPDPDWQHGFAVVYVDKKSGYFHVNQVPIFEHKFVFQGSVYRG